MRLVRLCGWLSPLVLALGCLPAMARGGLVFEVDVDTSSLQGQGTFALAFTLLDGDGLQNTTLTLSNYQFGGGSPLGNPSLIGGAGGELGSTVTLTDTDFFNDFVQAFDPGGFLSFQISLSSTADSSITPDSFSFGILQDVLLDGDGAIIDEGSPIPTLDPTFSDTFLAVDLSSSTTLLGIETFASDPSLTSFEIPSPTVEVVGVVPEPATWTMGLTGALLAFAGWRWSQGISPQVIRGCQIAPEKPRHQSSKLTGGC